MRVNIYSEELTGDVQTVSTVARDTGITHFGVRFILKSADCLHNTPTDDDRSAVTFWIPEGVNFSPAWLRGLFLLAARAVDEAVNAGAGMRKADNEQHG